MAASLHRRAAIAVYGPVGNINCGQGGGIRREFAIFAEVFAVMKKIDRETVQRILDTADIVEVVSDFVHLKRRGANYIGLCPFHNERTPSFSVSKAKGICKCFSCGKGGSPVGFIMEHEQLSYNEALRYLAKKYNIEIKEHEMTDKEREEASERESMLAVNEFALNHFEQNLSETDDGRDIGLAYFRERGINDASVKKFRLGYSLDKRDDLLTAAKNKGYNEKYLIDTGLCYKADNGRVYDRFKGRVMYPVFSVSGKVVAFGGRTLRKDKDVAKYVNSPESTVYRKSYELYGLYQAKKSIVQRDKCILVEGYMDVISMHQSGVENVVASSGTSLTEGQIRLIHRFTENVTVIYDSDAAGIKASLRGIDMLLAEGLNVKVLSLPDGDDPDSFAQSHSASELEEYLERNETDFIRFKTAILLQGVENDPIKRAKVIGDIVRSISVIPDDITRSVYVKECSRMLDIEEKVLTLQVAKIINERAVKEAGKTQYQSRDNEDVAVAGNAVIADVAGRFPDRKTAEDSAGDVSRFLYPYEKEVLRYVLKYGMLDLCEACDENGNTFPIKVIEYIDDELRSDEIVFTNSGFARTYGEALNVSRATWQQDYDRQAEVLTARRLETIAKGEEEIRLTVSDLGSIAAREKALETKADNEYLESVASFSAMYIERILGSSPDDTVRQITTDLVSEKYVLSKVHTKYTKVETEQDRLADLVPRALYEWKDAILDCRIRELHRRIKEVSSQPDADGTQLRELMIQNIELMRLKSEFAKYLGERIVAPRK